jgi:hypothetical protein
MAYVTAFDEFWSEESFGTTMSCGGGEASFSF